ncbi:MAG: M50 family metallopeptidase [Lachnospiraceae bacterium]|nr:M50 family metallopeptidase [Lachnospiraceae bacterium]
MENTKKKNKLNWKNYIGFIIMLGIGFIGGNLLSVIGESRDPNYVNMSVEMFILREIIEIVSYIILVYVNIIIHEAGHLVFGLLSGYKFNSFRIGSYMWIKKEGRVQFKRFNLVGTGGQCLMSPPDKKDGKYPFALYNLGGSLLNLIVGLISVVVYILLPSGGLVADIVLFNAFVGIAFALINGIPLRFPGINNDGYNTYDISRNNDALKAMWIQLKINEEISKGVRIGSMEEEMFKMPSDDAVKNSLVATIAVLNCNRLLDQHKFEESGNTISHLLNIESGVIGLHRKLLICDQIYIELITKNRKEVLDELMSKEQIKFMKQMQSYPSVIRTQYAYTLLGEKDKDKAIEIKDIFERRAKSYPYEVEMIAEKELIEIADSVLE